MAARPSPLSNDEFHRLYDDAKPAYEYWHGEAVQKPMPTTLHGIVQLVLALLLERAGWNTSLEVRLKIVSDAEPVPDLIAIKGKFKGSYPTTSPELCVEILSPGDVLSKALKTANTYITWGSQSVWIIDPDKRTAWTFSRDEAHNPKWISPDGALQISATSINLEALFAEVDQRFDR